jgi:translation initiation factor IF-3
LNLKINSEITSQKIILIDGDNIRPMMVEEALSIAKDRNLDLVQFPSNSENPSSFCICKILDYQRLLRGKSSKPHLKIVTSEKKKGLVQVKFRPSTSEYDYDKKIDTMIDYLRAGHPVRARIKFKGKEQKRPELGHEMIKKIAYDVSIFGIQIGSTMAEGKNLFINIFPCKEKSPAISC